jgi:hypothetical protein
MKAHLKKELYWALGIICLTQIAGFVIFGGKLFNGRLLDLQIHDTYFIFPKYFFLAAVFIFLLVGMYLNRAIYWKLNNRVLSVLTMLILTLVLIGLINYMNWVYGYVKDSGYYLFDERSQTERISEFVMTYWILTIVIFVTVSAIMTTGYKILKPKRVD